jgi:NAD(P) transhydrogenase
MPEKYEMVVIGAGPAGEKAAAQAAYFGHRVAIVEQQATPGGAPVHSGHVPNKTLREAALYITGFRQRDVYGVGIDLEPHTALARLETRRDDVVRVMTEAVAVNIASHGIDLVHGTARLRPGGIVEVSTSGGETRTLQGNTILIATGSRPFHPAGIPFDDPDVRDTETVLHLDRPVRSLVVIGGGAVGCEYASIFAVLGVDVTLVDNAPRLLPFMDGEVSDLLAETFRGFGMRVFLQAGRAAIARDAEGLRATLACGEVLRPERVLVAAGRVGNTDALDLPGVGVATDERGRIRVDAEYRTTAPGIYAAGDVIGPPALASVSMEQGRVAACHAFNIPFKDTVDLLPPFGVFSIPEVSMVGMSEEAAAAAGEDYEVGRSWFRTNTRSTIEGDTDGLLKLVFRRADRTLLGVHLLGTSAGDLVHQGQAVLHFGGTIDYFIHTTYNVPTRSEAYKYAAYDGLQHLAARMSEK